MKRGWLVFALLLSLGVNLGLVGVAVARRAGLERWQRMARAEAPPPEGLGRRLAERLGVPAERRERFLAIQRQLVERSGEERREVMRLRFALRRELLAAHPDRERIDALVGELDRREAALNRAFVASVLESREVLDDRELELYLRFLERAGAGGLRRGPGMSDGPPRRPPPDRP